MPKNLDNYLADRVLTRQLYLMRFSAGEQKKVLAVIVDMRAERVAKLRAGDVTDFSRARVNKLLSDSTAIIEAAYKEMAPKIETPLRDLGIPLPKGILDTPDNRAIEWVKSGKYYVNKQPLVLYHGTTKSSILKIEKEGLRFGNLTFSPSYAKEIARIRRTG